MGVGLAEIARRALRTSARLRARVRARAFCPCCQRAVDSWQDWSPTYRGTICPHCHSHPRHRLMSLYFDQLEASLPACAVLHLAPEKVLAQQLRDASREYVRADLRPSDASYALDPNQILDNQVDVVTDVTDLRFGDERFDIVVCSHVLEHVTNDHKALTEIHRVLAPNGWALLQTPFDRGRATALEDARIKTPAQRLKYYWQEDHVRLYGRDIFQRFSAAGFLPAIIPPGVLCKSPAFFGLHPDEDLMLARKQSRLPRFAGDRAAAAPKT